MARAKRRQRRRGQDEWTAIVRRYGDSELSKERFCQREGVSVSSLDRWRKRIDSRPEPDFVVLEPPSAAHPDRWELDIALPNGVALRFRG